MRSCLLRLLALAVVLVIGLIGVLYITNDPSPVGHFHTVDGEARYKRSYARAMETLPSPTRTTDVKTSYGSVRVYEFKTLNPDEHGAGIPVVLLPGRTSGVPMWATNIGGLLAQRTVYALDALGDAGMSVQTRAIESSADQGAWIEETFTQLGLASFHLVGHSFGGWLAANYAARHPARVQTLNLLEPVFVFQGLRWQVYAVTIPAALPFLPQPDGRDRWSAWSRLAERISCSSEGDDRNRDAERSVTPHAFSRIVHESTARDRQRAVTFLAAHDASRSRAIVVRQSVDDRRSQGFSTTPQAIRGPALPAGSVLLSSGLA